MITKLTFLIIILILILSFFYGMYKESELNTKFKDSHNTKKKTLGYFNIFNLTLIVLLLISYIWVFPNVIIFESCSKIEKNILINPFKTYLDISFDYGNNISYVINNSDENLEIVQLEYGYSSNDEENSKQIISANSAQKIEISHFDFINEIVPKHIRTKSSKTTYFYIGCESSNDINFMFTK
ncbi:hypothetical protein ACLHWS_08715 [Flavobacterium psychrophilum]|uniref:hypothetical protein n=1 Tax=Flavobacterium psychrophilum TaxID=96345 RepID=UPI000B7C42E2|nr:hypothetical protein [Flavobacterium psychrophilum]MCB6089697.1 hypothetical protein [Flavobacterium psychrophilum]MCB6232178.1 hypothetical protein [Flavobacterium psychrophilum]MEB3383085.1 hypothetical protein [Flavobacterium psychrophilum]SNA87950.1 hypothetical protein FI146_680003 [Flavobacterium psychrophilum]